jgi:beta-glucosidase
MSNTKLHNLLLLSAAGVLAVPACSLPPPASVQQTDSGVAATCQADADGYPTHQNVDGGTSAEGTTFTPAACSADNSKPALSLFSYLEPYSPSPGDITTAKQIVSTMSLSELATQMRGMPFKSASSPQFADTQRSLDTSSVRGYLYRDASRGVNFGEDMKGSLPNAIDPITGKPSGVGYATTFPVSMARGAAFDLDLEYAIGEAIGDEMQAAGESLLLAPCMNVLRHPLWGRAQETYGEDSFHIGRLATAMVIGIQQHITANAKHFMAYNIENGRNTKNNSIVEERALREIYGRHFRMVVQDGGVASVMASYNKVNGVKSTENSHILTDVLRNDFGFQGFVLSDWWAMPNDAATDPTVLKGDAIQGVQAGLDVELPWALNYGQLESIVNSNGLVKQQDLITSATRVVLQKNRFNSIALGKKCGLGTPITTFRKGAIGGCDVVHVNLARRAALESMVLLKNKNSVLPISSTVKKVAVVGATVKYVADDGKGNLGGTINFATDVVTGDKGSSRVFSDPTKEVGPWAGINKFKPSQDINVVHGSTLDEVGTDADFYVVVAGLTPQDEGEEYTKAGDRLNFLLDGKPGEPTGLQNALIQQVAQLNKPMVVMLEGGSVIDMSSWLDQVPAVVMAWYPGMVGGDAMGMLLWGDVSFSGKLPLTWGSPNQYGPLAAEDSNTTDEFFFGYREFDQNGKTPVFQFGDGLSYTSFEYGDTQLGCTTLSKGSVLPVTVSVKNTGGMAGDETVMVFVSFPNSAVTRGPKELKGFARVSLAAGEQKQVSIPIRLKDLDYFQVTDANARTGQWVVESGNVDIWVGGSYATLNKVGSVPVNGYSVASSKDHP